MSSPQSTHHATLSACIECAGRYEAKSDGQVFCSTPCRNAYNNRRNRRGSILYDIFMELRYRRQSARGLWSVMCRLAEEWRDADKEDHRADFKSWRDPRQHLDAKPYLLAKRGRI